MATVADKKKAKRKTKSKSIPEYLIYEMDEGKPIYYRDYQLYLQEHKELEEIMGSSFLQSLLVTLLVQELGKLLPHEFQVLTNEVGIQFKKKSWRAADIAIYEKAKLKDLALENKYLTIPPKVVIEVDTKASLEHFNTAMDYYYKKTDAFLDFGVEKVVWIFTDARKVMVAEKNQPWLTSNWSDTVEVMENISFTLETLVEQR